MKKLIITHKVDIDGLGGAVLANIAYGKENVDYMLAMPSDIDSITESVINTNKHLEYDKIYITDICPTDRVLQMIDDNKDIKSKLLIFDHHEGRIADLTRNYTFLTEKFDNEKGKTCGTSLFYDYLISNNLICKKESIEKLVELTRRYDTWEWKDIYNDLEADRLTTLMEALGYDLYITHITEKLLENDVFVFNDLENSLIDNKKAEIENYIKEALNTMYVTKMDGKDVAIIYAEKYRNDIKDYISENKIVDVDLLIIIKLKEQSISYRSMKENVDVNAFARKYAGGGHFEASGSHISSEKLKEITNIIFK